MTTRLCLCGRVRACGSMRALAYIACTHPPAHTRARIYPDTHRHTRTHPTHQPTHANTCIHTHPLTHTQTQRPTRPHTTTHAHTLTLSHTHTSTQVRVAAAQLVHKVLTDETVHRQGGDAIWKAFKFSLPGSRLFSKSASSGGDSTPPTSPGEPKGRAGDEGVCVYVCVLRVLVNACVC